MYHIFFIHSYVFGQLGDFWHLLCHDERFEFHSELHGKPSILRESLCYMEFTVENNVYLIIIIYKLYVTHFYISEI